MKGGQSKSQKGKAGFLLAPRASTNVTFPVRTSACGFPIELFFCLILHVIRLLGRPLPDTCGSNTDWDPFA